MKKGFLLLCAAVLLCALPLPARRGTPPAAAGAAAPALQAEAPEPSAASPCPSAAGETKAPTGGPAAAAGETEVPAGETAVPTGGPIAPADEASAPEASAAAQTVRLLSDGQVLELDMDDYLTGVLAAEMPADFALEALKAQAVAARTYTLYCAASGKHAQADVCADYRCCQAWLDEATLRERWGEACASRLARLRQAVEETAGESLRYEGRPVFAAFHASSPGATEDSGQVWRAQPYLVSVSSPETDETVPDLISVRELTALDLRDTVLAVHPEADFTGAPEDWAGQPSLDASGRVERMVLGGVELSGVELRRLFGLRSTAFVLEYRDGLFRFTVSGSGHGVGLSQQGAQLLALDGLSYREILAHYYPGTELVRAGG